MEGNKPSLSKAAGALFGLTPAGTRPETRLANACGNEGLVPHGNLGEKKAKSRLAASLVGWGPSLQGWRPEAIVVHETQRGSPD